MDLLERIRLSQLLGKPVYNEFEDLKLLLESDYWPNNPNPPDEIDKIEEILDIFIDMDLKDKKFLDISGITLSRIQSRQPKHASSIIEGHYDAILLYDVLDHMESDVVLLLNKINKCCHKDTKIYVRCHPWCSRTGGHLPKPYMQLIFTEGELNQLGYEIKPMQKIIHPLLQYQDWFMQTNFTIIKSNVVRSHLDGFFIDTPLIANRIKQNWKRSHIEDLRNGEFPRQQIVQHYVDFILKIR